MKINEVRNWRDYIDQAKALIDGGYVDPDLFSVEELSKKLFNINNSVDRGTAIPTDSNTKQ